MTGYYDNHRKPIMITGHTISLLIIFLAGRTLVIFFLKTNELFHELCCDTQNGKRLTSRTLSLIIPSPSLSKALKAPARHTAGDSLPVCLYEASAHTAGCVLQWFILTHFKPQAMKIF